MKLYLIRHAQSLNNALPEPDRVEDPPLTDIGHQQCAYLARWAASFQWTHIVTSPFLRTLQTANYLRQSIGLTPLVRIDLHELGGCVRGSRSTLLEGRPGMTRSEIRRQFPEFELSADIGDKGWWGSQPLESPELARKRAQRLLLRTVKEFAGTDTQIAFVMHGDIKRLLLESIDGRPREMPFNASVTRVLAEAHHCRFDEYNQVQHLPPDLVTS